MRKPLSLKINKRNEIKEIFFVEGAREKIRVILRGRSINVGKI